MRTTASRRVAASLPTMSYQISLEAWIAKQEPDQWSADQYDHALQFMHDDPMIIELPLYGKPEGQKYKAWFDSFEVTRENVLYLCFVLRKGGIVQRRPLMTVKFIQKIGKRESVKAEGSVAT